VSFLSEIRRRKVFQVAAVYAVVAWLLVQIVSTVEAPLSLPDWFDTAIIVLLAVGFPIAVILSWAFDLTSEGVVRDRGVGPSTLRDGSWRTMDFILAALLVVAIAWIGYREINSPTPNGSALPNSIAVLPFENLSPNSEDAYFAAGIHDQIINELARIRDLSVIARTSVMQYAGAARPMTEIADELHVEMVMEGSVRYANDRVRVTAQLIDGSTGLHLWTEDYDGDLDDIFAIQSDIATRIAMALEAELSVGERLAIARQPTVSPDAFIYYLRAIDLFNSVAPVQNADELASALQLLDQALLIDPDYADAFAAKANIYISLAGSNPGSPEARIQRVQEIETAATEAAEQALMLDPNNALAYLALHTIHLSNWRARDARSALEKAVQLSPNNFEVISSYATFHSYIGQHEEAIRLQRRALELAPSWQTLHVLAITYLLGGQIDAAYSTFGQAAELNPSAFITHVQLARIEIIRRDLSAALERTRLSETLISEDSAPMAYAYVAYNYALAGSAADAERLVSRLKEIAQDTFVAPVAWAYAYLAVRDREQALRWTETAGTSWTALPLRVMYLKENIFGDPLLEEPEFLEVRRALGFADLR